MNLKIQQLFEIIENNNGIGDKSKLINVILESINLVKDRSVYYCESFAIRFSQSATNSFSNTVLSLSNLQKYDSIPFFVCNVRAKINDVYLANTTFLSKVSHSSQALRVDNIKGSFNGSDIVKEFNNLSNCPDNFLDLFAIHEQIGFEGNLIRLVDSTNNITPSGTKYELNNAKIDILLSSPERAEHFYLSKSYTQLKEELDNRVNRFKDEIVVAGFIENVNLRGRIIEYLIAGEDDIVKSEIIRELNTNRYNTRFKTENTLGDYVFDFPEYSTATDIKTKIMILNSNPKGYNIDKVLEFLSNEKTVFLFYFIGIEPGRIVNTALTSIFQKDLLSSTILLKHWAGRNSRGVTQFQGNSISQILLTETKEIDLKQSKEFLARLMSL